MTKRMRQRDASKSGDWEDYNENFHDLISRSKSPLRKTRRHSKTKLHCITDLKEESFSQDGSIRWSSSDGESRKENDSQDDIVLSKSDAPASPIMCGSSHKQSLNSGGSFIKSTPSGSPIFSQNRFSTVIKRARKPSLLPISPITPGLQCGYSFASTSYYSLNAEEETIAENSDLDHTPLAFPLADSDAEDLDDAIKSQPGATNNSSFVIDDIEDVLTQPTQSVFIKKHNIYMDDEVDISTLDETTESDVSQEKLSLDSLPKQSIASSSNVKGSVWIESLIGKLDEQRADIPAIDICNTAHAPTFDSVKKRKFIKDGLAEQLQRVLRQEQSRKVLFQHQLKEASYQEKEVFQRSLTLKVISYHREGFLHVLECKVISSSKLDNTGNKFFTLLLQHDDVVTNNLNLTSVFTVYPPWKEIKVKEHDFPVLLCVYHIQVAGSNIKDHTSDRSGDIRPKMEKPRTDYSNTNRTCFRTCESLLEELESEDSTDGICLAATVQRIYQDSQHIATLRKTILCEDAFGVFFEIIVDAALCSHQSWIHLFKQAEGQRVYFKDLFLSGRTTRVQRPTLFHLIDFLWNPGGFGLLQVQNSQSQSQDSTSTSCSQTPHLQAPSFCYKLLARRERTTYLLPEAICEDVESHICGDLNRPRMDGSTRTDVLYRESVYNKLADILQAAETSTDYYVRQSFTCKVLFHFQPQAIDDMASDHTFIKSPHKCQLHVIDETRSKASEVVRVEISTRRHGSIADISGGDVILVKDACLQQDGSLIIDSYSEVTVLNKSGCRRENYNVGSLVISIEKLENLKLKKLPVLSGTTEPGAFVTIEGVICGLMPENSRDESLRHHTKTSHDYIQTQREDDTQELLGNNMKMLVIVELVYKVKLTVLQHTAWSLVSNFKPSQNVCSSSLNGVTVGPVLCFIRSKSINSLQTIFVAEEVLT